MSIVILEFLIFSFFGWIIDSAYRSFLLHKPINGGFFRGPICPIYGVGAVVLLFIFKTFSFLPVWLVVGIGWLAMVLVEYVGAVFSEKVLQIKLWDYSDSRFDFKGRIDLAHSIYWLGLSVFFYYFILPNLIRLENSLHTPFYLDVPLVLIFFVILIWATVNKAPAKFLEFKEKVLDISVGEYQQMISDIKKYYRLKTEEAKKVLGQRINERLQRAGAKLKEKK